MKIQEFMQTVANDEKLMSEWQECIGKVDAKDKEAQIKATVDFAAAHGLDLSYGDIVMEVAGNAELDDDELDAVTGGWGPGNCGEASSNGDVVCPLADEFCGIDYWCWIGWKHE